MYKMGLLTGARTKSANIVGQTMRLNPHGDAAIYDTMVRLSKGYGALLHALCGLQGQLRQGLLPGHGLGRPPVYGGQAGRPSATSCSGTSTSDTVDFVDNYDNTMKEPALLPTTFPNILVSANQRHRRGHGLPVLRLQPERGLRHHHRLPEEPGLRPDGRPCWPRTSPPAGELIYDAAHHPGDLPAPAGAASGSGPNTAMSRRRTSLRSTRSPTPPPWRPSWTRWRS